MAGAVAVTIAATVAPWIAEAHPGLHLGHREALVELDRHRGAVRLLHVRLIDPVASIGLDPDDGAAGHGLERGRLGLLGGRAGEHLLVAAHSGRPAGQWAFGWARWGGGAGPVARAAARRAGSRATACGEGAGSAGERPTGDDSGSDQRHGPATAWSRLGLRVVVGEPVRAPQVIHESSSVPV